MDEIEKYKSLKEQLDEIDNKIYYDAFDNLFNSRLNLLIGMWKKGQIVSTYRGVKVLTFYQLEEETGRSHNHLKRWNDLYEKYPELNEYIEKYAKPRAEAWTNKILNPKKENKSEELPLPEGKFSIIYADPPWPVESIILDDKWTSGIEDKYPTMTVEEIKELKIPLISAENCSLFIWTTHSFLPDCLEVIKSWGFKYFCTITWNKHSGWTHYGFHKMTEFLLYAYKGKININTEGKAIPTLIEEVKTYHSKKPDSIRELLELKTPDLTSKDRLELFARNIYENWTCWGNEIIIEEDE